MNIEKFKLHERIKISYLKHRGNILAVVEELGVDAGYVRRVAEKIKGRERRDVDFLMANDLMQCILMGYESRVRHLMHMLSTLDQREQVRLSLCCNSTVEAKQKRRKICYICIKCGKEATTNVLDKAEIYELKQNIIGELREEDTALINFAEKMGYTKKEAPQPAPVLKQNFLVIGSKSKMSQAQLLDPIEREQLTKAIQKELADAEGAEEGEVS